MSPKSLFFVLPLLTLLAACGANIEQDYPQTLEDEREAEWGKLTGEGGLKIFGSGNDEDDSSAAGASPIGVNSFLWRATLDTLSFMPLTSADPFGGVVITDWYADPETPNKRFKINAMIMDKTLRANGIKVSIFKQVKNAGSNAWEDAPVEENAARQLEDTILTRARELKVKQATK